MIVRQSLLASPLRVVGAALAVILLFGAVFPFVGGFAESASQSGVAITYTLELSHLSQPEFAAIVLLRSLDLSVRTFTLSVPNRYTVFGAARILAYVESLLGMGFIALLTASLVRES